MFEAMLANATRICEAKFGVLWTYDGERLHAIALHGVPQAFTEFVQKPMQPVPSGAFMKLIGGEAVHQIVDLANSELYGSSPLRRAFVELGGAQTMLWIALRKDDVLLGALAIYRQDIRAFSDRQIGLVKNFAAQAVIAIENTRLLNELRQRTDDLPNRWSSRPRPPTCCRSSAGRRAVWSWCSSPCWRTQPASARPSSAIFSCTTRTEFRSVAMHGVPPHGPSFCSAIR